MSFWFKLQLILILALGTLNGIVLWQTASYPIKVETLRQTPAPQGKTYLDTCDGRPTHYLGNPDEGCLADYPGEFALSIILGGSITLLLFVNIIAFLLRHLFFKSRQKQISSRGKTRG